MAERKPKSPFTDIQYLDIEAEWYPSNTRIKTMWVWFWGQVLRVGREWIWLGKRTFQEAKSTPTFAVWMDWIAYIAWIDVTQINLPNSTTANSFHIKNDWDTWWWCNVASFASDIENATAYVLKTWVAKFKSITLSTSVVLSWLQAWSSIDGQYIQNASISANKIQNASITATQIAALTITASEIWSLAITTTKIDSNAVTNTKVADWAITYQKISVVSLSAITANIWKVTAWTIVWNLIQTSEWVDRTQLNYSTNRMEVYINDVLTWYFWKTWVSDWRIFYITDSYNTYSVARIDNSWTAWCLYLYNSNTSGSCLTLNATWSSGRALVVVDWQVNMEYADRLRIPVWASKY